MNTAALLLALASIQPAPDEIDRRLDCLDLRYYLAFTDGATCDDVRSYTFAGDPHLTLFRRSPGDRLSSLLWTTELRFNHPVMILGNLPARRNSVVHFALNYSNNTMLIGVTLARVVFYRNRYCIASGTLLTVAVDIDTHEVRWVDTSIRW